jgi:hypothetical protein
VNNPNDILDQALTHVESESIRQWVKSDHNLPIWKAFVAKKPDIDPMKLAILIVSHAIGL